MTCDADWQPGLVTDDQDPAITDVDFGNCRHAVGVLHLTRLRWIGLREAGLRLSRRVRTGRGQRPASGKNNMQLTNHDDA